MHSFNPSKIELSIKDSTKGQKIAAALYLVTAHLSDSDPMKNTLRSQSMTFIAGGTSHEIQSLAERITETLTIAVLAQLISEKNASIIILELRHFVALSVGAGDSLNERLVAHFGDTADQYNQTLPSNKKTFTQASSIGQSSLRNTSFSSGSTTAKEIARQGIKSDRQEQILSLINERKSAGIKDIAGLFPETSEKTIQRELGALVASGRITKRGQKRWSVYMAVTN